MTWEELVALGKTLSETSEEPSYGTPGLKVRGKLLARLRPEDDSVVFLDVGFDEREMLIEADPATFYFTAHYKDYPTILARLGALDAPTAMRLLERRWRTAAPKRLVAAYDQQRADSPNPRP